MFVGTFVRDDITVHFDFLHIVTCTCQVPGQLDLMPVSVLWRLQVSRNIRQVEHDVLFFCHEPLWHSYYLPTVFVTVFVLILIPPWVSSRSFQVWEMKLPDPSVFPRGVCRKTPGRPGW